MAKKPKTADLTYEQVQQIKSTLWEVPGVGAAPTAGAMAVPRDLGAAIFEATAVRGPTVIAEGDSWFDYPPTLDLLDQLKLRHRYNIVSLAQAGDTIENMAFGTQVGRDFSRTEPQINLLIDAVARHQPKVVLLSGGGNDVAGDEFAAFLNHADSGLPPLRAAYMQEVIHGVVRKAFERIATEVWKVDSTIAIITHGYGHAIPDGRAVFNFPFGFHFLGPWLKPALVSRNITKLSDGKAIVKTILDEFNTMLIGLQTSLPGTFRHVDLRGTVKPADWVNELHVNSESYGRCADKFQVVIKEFV